MSDLKSTLSGSLKEYLTQKSASLARRESAVAELKRLKEELCQTEPSPVITRYTGKTLDVVLPISAKYKDESLEGLRSALYDDIRKVLGKDVEEGQYNKEYVSLRVKAGKRSVKRIIGAIKTLSQKYEKEYGIKLDVEDLSMGIFMPHTYEPVAEPAEKQMQKTFDRREVIRDIATGFSQSDVVTKYKDQGFTRGDYLDLRKKLKTRQYKGLLKSQKEKNAGKFDESTKARLIAKLKTYKTKPPQGDWESIKKEYGLNGRVLWGLYLSNVKQGQGKHK